MPSTSLRPSWVIGHSLNCALFDCCGDEDLFPFKCHACGRPLVICTECDTLYTDLHDLSSRRSLNASSGYQCPGCGTPFEDNFMRAPHRRIGFDEWHQRGLDSLLLDRPFQDLVEMLTASAAQLANFMRRGMRSTAQTRITDFRNLAEAMAVRLPEAADVRKRGYDVANASGLSKAMEWHSRIRDSGTRAYALLGITDAAIP